MIEKYKDLLPSYLDGNNIKKHCNILDTQNIKLNNKIELLNTWNKIDRPILIKKSQSSINRANITVYVNVEQPIKEVKINVNGYTNLYFFLEEEQVTTFEKSEIHYDQGHLSFNMPILVEVTTYEDNYYVKGYPENDTIQNNENDHDVFLDIIGKLLGIPRRTYFDWITDSSSIQDDLMYTSPPYFLKYDYQGNMISGTEDDYYYSERLKYFIQNYQNKFLPQLMMEVLYDWESTHVYNEYNRETSIVEGDDNSFYLITTDSDILPINIDVSNVVDKINKYAPITRPVNIRKSENTELILSDYVFEGFPNSLSIPYELLVSETGEFIDKAPITIEYDNKRRIEYTDVNNYSSQYGSHTLDLFGLTSNFNFRDISLQYEGEFELINSNIEQCSCLVYPEYSLDLEYWKYNQFAGSTSTNLTPPRINGDGYLSFGRGMISYTPAVYKPIENPCRIQLSFCYGRRYSQIGISGVKIDENNKANWIGGLSIKPYDYLGIGTYNDFHSLDYTFNDGIAIISLDDTEIKRVELQNNIDMYYIAGYTSDDESDSKKYGLYIEYANIEEYVA